MNKQGKTNKLMIFVVLAVLAVGFFYMYSGEAGKTILEHKAPADISDKEKGTGLDLSFYDEDGNPIEIPDWFSTASIIPLGQFSIVRHPPAPSCTTVTQCSGYATNPDIGCWNGKCVLRNVASMNAGVNVENPVSSEISFLSVVPSAATPAVFWTNLEKTSTTLNPGEFVTWGTALTDGGLGPMSVTGWDGTQQTFTITVSGVNEYTGEVFTVSDTITLAFDANPTGGFIISLETPVPV